MDPFEKYSSEILDVKYLASLYNPEFKRVEGLYFLSAHLDGNSLSRWSKNPRYLQAPEKLENTINHVHLDELIENEERQYEIGIILQQRWLEKLTQEFPNQEFEVNISRLKDGSWELKMWTKRVDDEKTSKRKTG